MRTTVTLEPDVVTLVRTAMRRHGISFKEALNDAVRAGLTPTRQKQVPFRQKTFALGAEQYFHWDKALATAAAMEDEETARKLALRK